MSKAQTQQTLDEKFTESEQASVSAPLLVSQCGSLLLLMLKFKAWRAVFLVVPVALAMSNLFVLPMFNKKPVNNPESGLKFYGTSDLVSSGKRVYVDRTAFPTKTKAVSSILTERGGSADWLTDCSSESECRAKFVSESDPSIIGYMRFSQTPSKRATLECLMVLGSRLRCPFLYHVMAQAMHKNSLADAVFKDVDFFLLNYEPDKSQKDKEVNRAEPLKNISLPASICADWINEGKFFVMMEITVPITLLLTTLGVTFYFLISTFSCIRILKTDEFLQELVRKGLSPTAYWAVIWLTTVIECILFSGVFTFSQALQCPGVYPAGNMSLVFAFTLFYCLSFAAIAFLVELLVPSIIAASMLITAAAIGTFLAFLSYNDSKYVKLYAAYILPFIRANAYLSAYMASDMKRRLEEPNAMDPAIQSFLPSVAAFVLLLALLIIYLDCLVRTGNGLRLPLSYPFRCGFWNPKSMKSQGDNAGPDSKESGPHIEPVIGFTPSIMVDKVCKSYRVGICCSAGSQVLNGLSCKIYRDQITALIGHNGAGKSTLIKILTGEECPDTGVAYVNGFNVTDPLERLALRGSISICPQFDALCAALTVMESIRITLNCKGANNISEVERARAMLRRLGLEDKENVKSTDLSGGQKRKVNTILALLGDPKVVFLDEPTSGLDPVSRRQLWQLLQEEKLGRSIVLCTQFMDEADVLADRKIFLCGGQIVCAGSSMFLKSAFGCSFTLNVSLKSKSDAPSLMSKLSQVQLKSQFETELQIDVPASKPKILVEAVQVLENSQVVEAFGLSQATLDDIFMKLSGVSSAEIIDAFQSGKLASFLNNAEKNQKTKDRVGLIQSLEPSARVKSSIIRQFGALLRTNMKRQVRTRSSILSRFFVPAVLLAIMAYGTVKIMRDYDSKKQEATHNEMLLEAGASRQGSNVHSVKTTDFNLITFCVHDGPETADHITSCASLAFLNKFSFLSKPKSETLKSFLEKNSTIQNLLTGCTDPKRPYSNAPCVVYYASSWNKSESNKNRAVSIGVFAKESDTDTVPVHRKAFAAVSALFGAGMLNGTTALAHMKPFSQFTANEFELLMFFMIFCLFPVSYLSDPIEDIASRVRGHLTSLGMTHLAYWINTFLLHWVQYTTCFTASVAILCIWDRYRNGYFLLACLPTLFLGTASNQLTVYTVAAITRTRNTIVSLTCCLGSLALPMVLFVVSTKGTAVLVPLICLVPPIAPIALIYFSVAYAIYNMDYYNLDNISDVPDLYENCWNNSLILLSLIVMPIHIGGMCCIIAAAENSATIWDASCRRNSTGVADKAVSAMDQGALKEAERVLQSIQNPLNVLEVRQLSKTYPNGVRAVRGVTFGTMAGEIFGLLGANGAGKTTTMSVIVGEESATSGQCEVRVKDSSWVSGRASASIGAIGYCPQHNPLFDTVTVAEHLGLYADIRGVPSGAAERQITGLIQGLGLLPHRDKYAAQLSGGNKRRLCLAIALLGDPALIVIDEASTGVDPENKRFIWSAIRGMLHEQRSVMVTTHSMEEVEALCSRVGIMNKGRMIAFGSVQQLRSLHGDAYTLDVLLKVEKDEKAIQRRKAAIRSAVVSQFKGAVVLEDLSLCTQFYVSKGSVGSLSGALQWLTANQVALGMEHYSFYQMSLDQVFVKLVKQYGASSGSE